MYYNYYSEDITELKENEIFVFGSNLAGRHGKGTALAAKKLFGAKYGVGWGFAGRCYALPTKGYNLENSLPITEISKYVKCFKQSQLLEPDLIYLVSKIGCGLAGYKDSEIAPLFKGCEYSNTKFHVDWKEYLE